MIQHASVHTLTGRGQANTQNEEDSSDDSEDVKEAKAIRKAAATAAAAEAALKKNTFLFAEGTAISRLLHPIRHVITIENEAGKGGRVLGWPPHCDIDTAPLRMADARAIDLSSLLPSCSTDRNGRALAFLRGGAPCVRALAGALVVVVAAHIVCSPA